MKTKFQVVLGLSRLNASNLLTFGLSVVSKINAASATFTTPSPALADISSALSELQTAIENANGGGLVETDILNEKRLIVEQLLTAEGHYVEDVANDPANDGSEATIIDTAGMRVKGFTPRQRRVFSVQVGKLMATVDLFAASIKRGAHEWEYTLTPDDAASWIAAAPTTKASTTISSLTLYQRYYFRHRAIAVGLLPDWEEPLSIVVV